MEDEQGGERARRPAPAALGWGAEGSWPAGALGSGDRSVLARGVRVRGVTGDGVVLVRVQVLRGRDRRPCAQPGCCVRPKDNLR